MEASTTNGANLRSLSEVLKEFLESINIMYTPEGMSASAFDHNTIALINFHIPKDAFDRYLCQGNFVACLNMNVLHNTLKAVGATRSALTQRIDPKHPDVMQVKICNAETRTTSTSTLKLWGFSADHLEIPNSVFPYYIEMPAAYLQRHINYLCTLMNNENNNKRIEVVVDSTGRFDLSVEGEFGCTRIEIGQAEAGVKVHLGPVDPMHEDFGVPTQDEEIVYDEGSDDEDEGEEVEDGDEAVPGSKRKRGTQGGRKKSTKKAKRAGFVVPQDRGQVMDDAVAEVEQERENVRQPPVKEYYNIKYFKSIAKAASLSATVLIFIRPNYPIVFLYRIGTMGKVCFCLSPAIAGTAAGAKEVDKDDEQAGDEAEEEEIVDEEGEGNEEGQEEIYYDDDNDAGAPASGNEQTSGDDMEEEPGDIDQQEDYEEDIVPEE